MPATVPSRYRSAFVAMAIALLGMGIAGPACSADPGAATDRPTTASPIKHVIVVIGENQSFDHLYGTHIPPSGDSISNLLVKGIVSPDGSPGRISPKHSSSRPRAKPAISSLSPRRTRPATRPCRHQP
jgi:phospholipase C